MIQLTAGIVGIVLVSVISLGIIIALSFIGRRISMMPEVKLLDPEHPNAHQLPHK